MTCQLVDVCQLADADLTLTLTQPSDPGRVLVEDFIVHVTLLFSTKDGRGFHVTRLIDYFAGGIYVAELTSDSHSREMAV